MENRAQKMIFSVFGEAFSFINPHLNNYSEFSKSLDKEIRNKTEHNIQYNFDIELDRIFKKQIENHGFSGKIFSEETGFYEKGDKKYKVVFDPFCNSTLASRTFRDAAAGISIFTYDYQFITSAILDYQTGIVGLIENGKTNFYQIQNKNKIAFSFSPVNKLAEAWVVITLENKKERARLDEAREILDKSKRIIINSGHIYWLRLATGAIDAYLDPFGGEPLYEMFASAIAQKSGCIVTGVDGEEFDPEKYLKIFEEDSNHKFYPVAARNEDLHEEIMKTFHGKRH